MFPSTGSEAITAAHLVLAANPVAPLMARFIADAVSEVAMRWFDPDVGGETPFLLWLCSSGGEDCR